MVNLNNQLTVDDMIVEYMIYKVRNGYETNFSASEFMDFLKFFETKMKVEDVLYDNEKLFKRFFERKIKSDWSMWDILKDSMVSSPHMDIEYINNDFIIKANYKLSDYDKSIINTYFMDNGMGKYDDYKGSVYKIRSIIGEYLFDKPKRKIDYSTKVSDEEIKTSKYISALIIDEIWDSYIKGEIKDERWPIQCRDINKYLFEVDLAKIINIKSIKNDLIELYNILSKRISILYHHDKKLEVSSYSNGYLARANYELLIKDYERIMEIAFGPYDKSLGFNLETSSFKESHEVGGFYDWDDDPDIETTIISIENDKVKKIVKNIEKIN